MSAEPLSPPTYTAAAATAGVAQKSCVCIRHSTCGYFPADEEVSLLEFERHVTGDQVGGVHVVRLFVLVVSRHVFSRSHLGSATSVRASLTPNKPRECNAAQIDTRVQRPHKAYTPFSKDVNALSTYDRDAHNIVPRTSLLDRRYVN